MENKQQKKHRAFTLIEFLVVITIIGLLIVAVSIKRRETITRKNVEIQALQVKQAIELARDYALTGEVISGQVPKDFEFLIDQSGTYTIKGDGISSPIKQGNFKKDDNNNDIEVYLGANQSFEYSVPHAEKSPSGDTQIILCGDAACSKSSMKYTITVTKNSVQLN
ncbi:MAG: type II secretion system protein [Patescibacteria group bacterium]|nr:type II secretion system GspH family protein [Patescibacteria group bacterium]